MGERLGAECGAAKTGSYGVCVTERRSMLAEIDRLRAALAQAEQGECQNCAEWESIADRATAQFAKAVDERQAAEALAARYREQWCVKADCYDAILRTFGIEGDVIGYIRRSEARVQELERERDEALAALRRAEIQLQPVQFKCATCGKHSVLGENGYWCFYCLGHGKFCVRCAKDHFGDHREIQARSLSPADWDAVRALVSGVQSLMQLLAFVDRAHGHQYTEVHRALPAVVALLERQS